MTAGRFVDTASWKRREHFELFRDAVQPFFALTAELDVSRLRSACATESRSYFLSALYATLRAANEVEAFRLRLRSGRVWLHERVGLTTTILREDETFAFARFEPAPSLEAFLAAGAGIVAQAKRSAPLQIPETDDDALIYHSTIPWLRFTSFTNAIGRHGDSVPRIVFGRCTREGLTASMPVSVEVHHALVDGLDVARFVERLQEHLERAGG